MASRIFCHQQRVTYADCTLGNHVYYSRYLEILEVCRGEFFRSVGVPLLELQEQDTIFPVVECRLSYKSPARYDDLLTIAVRVSKLERVRIVFGYTVNGPSGRLLLEAEMSHVCTSLVEKPKRIPEHLAALLSPFVQVIAPSQA
jgi:acyl-CoA thioester hydrolase